jgi:hypothetical protein
MFIAAFMVAGPVPILPRPESRTKVRSCTLRASATRDAERPRRLGQLDNVAGDDGAGAADHRDAAPDGLQRQLEQAQPLFARERPRFAVRPRHDAAVDALRHQNLDVFDEFLLVDLAILGERRNQGRVVPALGDFTVVHNPLLLCVSRPPPAPRR